MAGKKKPSAKKTAPGSKGGKMRSISKGKSMTAKELHAVKGGKKVKWNFS